MPKRSMWRVAQFDTLRLRLIKIAARVIEMKNDDPGALADLMPRSGFCASLWDAYRASSHDRWGHEAPNIHRRPFNPQTLIPQTRLQAGADEPRPNIGGIQKITRTQRNRARTRQSAALSGLSFED